MQKKNILWLREDFRLEDNPALYEVSKKSEKFTIFYIYNHKKFEDRSAQRWWLYQSLNNYQKKLGNIGIKLEIYEGNEIDIVKNLIKNENIDTFYWNTVFTPQELGIEKKVENLLDAKSILYQKFNGNLLQNPFDVKKKDNTHFQVFTPFWRTAEEIYLKSKNYFKKKINYKSKAISNANVDILEKKIKPNKDWYKKFNIYWKPGEDAAKSLLKNFIENNIKDYGTNRDIPSVEGTSKLSPYLAFGEISPQYILHECYKITKKNIGFRKYINEIGWREFSHHLLYHFPTMEKNNLRNQFDKFPWVNDRDKLNKWKKGITGYPIVDAGMRELYETGWMHNRVRMITASFLVKHLRIDWREGEKHFRDCLLDFNLPNNIAGWQWVAGCGADAAPYFRIFNPILQGEKFDPNGLYVKKWVKELKDIPKKYVHKPWEIPEMEKKLINFNLERNYYKPIVDHKIARELALAAFKELKK